MINLGEWLDVVIRQAQQGISARGRKAPQKRQLVLVWAELVNLKHQVSNPKET